MINLIKIPCRRFFAAVTFLTIIPVPGYSPTEDEIAHTKPYFPLIGLLVGVVVYGMMQTLIEFMPPAVVAVLVVILLGAASKGLHLDGLADTADGFLSSRPRERILEIMHDSRIGSMGVLALMAVLGLKTAGFFSIAAAEIPRIALLTAIVGRCGLTLYIFTSNYAREKGLGEIVFRYKSPFCFIWTLLFMFGSGYWLLAIQGLAIATAAVIFVILWTFYTCKKINGATGDTLGACEEICEMLVPILAACLTS